MLKVLTKATETDKKEGKKSKEVVDKSCRYITSPPPFLEGKVN